MIPITTDFHDLRVNSATFVAVSNYLFASAGMPARNAARQTIEKKSLKRTRHMILSFSGGLARDLLFKLHN
ncbi:MAG TPA: hypothetical protein VM425_02395 [Myxococcota bacterium]|nr:hypothetical protein [Myxococcota bacterium]